jgi:hypothetical protein
VSGLPVPIQLDFRPLAALPRIQPGTNADYQVFSDWLSTANNHRAAGFPKRTMQNPAESPPFTPLLCRQFIAVRHANRKLATRAGQDQRAKIPYPRSLAVTDLAVRRK